MILFAKSNTGITILTALCISGIILLLQHIKLDQTSTTLQMLSIEERQQLDHYQQLFQTDYEAIIIAIEPSTTIPATRLSGIERSLQSIDGVTGTTSSRTIDGNREKGGEFTDKDAVIFLVSISIEDTDTQAQQNRRAEVLIEEIRGKVGDHLVGDETALVSGAPRIRIASWQQTRQDLQMMIPLLIIMTTLISAFLFRSFTSILISLLLAALTTAFCMVGHLLLQSELSPFAIMMIPVIWSISVLDVFHLYSRINIKRRQKDPAPEATASKELYIPCLLTSLTTAACFLTLAVIDSSPLLTTVGIWGAGGTMIAFFLTFTLIRYLLTSDRQHRTNSVIWPGVLSLRIVRYSQHRPMPVIVFWIAAASLTVFTIPDLEVMPSPEIFTSENEITTEIEKLKTLTRSDLTPVDIIIEASNELGKNASRLASAALSVNNYLNTIEETRLVIPIDAIEEAEREAITRSLKETSETGSSTDGNLDPDIQSKLSSWLTFDEHTVRLQAYFDETSYQRKKEILRWLTHFDETMLNHHAIKLSGNGYFYHEIESRGLSGLLFSSFLSLFIIAATIYWITRNQIQTAYALITYLIPGLMVTGCMIMLDIKWTIALLPLPALLIGLMVDDTIHILWHSKSLKHRKTFSRQRLFRYNAIAAGPALLATTLILSGATATMASSQIQATYALGILIPVGLISAYLCNLSLIPAFNSLSRRSAR